MLRRLLGRPAQVPSQRSLERMLARATRVRMLDGGVSGSEPVGTEVMLDISDPVSIAALRDCLAIVEDRNTFGHCMCLGDYALLFCSGRRRIATIGLHHGRSIRWDAWKYDALLQDGPRLLSWLADQGVTAPLEAYQQDQRREEEYRQAAVRWQEAMPACLQPYWDQMRSFAGGMLTFVPSAQQGQGGSGQTEDAPGGLAPLLQALEGQFPDPDERVLALLEWYGSGKGPWSGYPAYEGVAEQLLLHFPTEQLVAALTRHPLSERHLEGSARYFAGYQFNTYRPDEAQQIPQELRERLLEHTQGPPDEDKVQRARGAFAA